MIGPLSPNSNRLPRKEGRSVTPYWDFTRLNEWFSPIIFMLPATHY
jgi:hypothetical protein